MIPADLTRLPVLPDEDQRHGPRVPIWVDRSGIWCAGVVVASAGPAVTVRYRLSQHGGTGVDTVGWPDLAVQQRTARDEFVDRVNVWGD